MKNKPCPFCNADPVKDTTADPNKRKGKLYAIYCDDCGTAATGWCDTEKEVDRRWNTRASTEEKQLAEELFAAKEEIKRLNSLMWNGVLGDFVIGFKA